MKEPRRKGLTPFVTYVRSFLFIAHAIVRSFAHAPRSPFLPVRPHRSAEHVWSSNASDDARSSKASRAKESKPRMTYTYIYIYIMVRFVKTILPNPCGKYLHDRSTMDNRTTFNDGPCSIPLPCLMVVPFKLVLSQRSSRKTEGSTCSFAKESTIAYHHCVPSFPHRRFQRATHQHYLGSGTASAWREPFLALESGIS